MKRRYKKTGFSLVELLVTVTIIGLITAIAAPSYLEYYRKTNLDNATKLLQASLNEGFSKSRSQAHHYEVSGEKDQPFFVIKKCEDKTCSSTTALYSLAQTTFPGDVQIISEAFRIRFLAPHGDLEFPDDASLEHLTITLKTHHYDSRTKIYKNSGLIERLP